MNYDKLSDEAKEWLLNRPVLGPNEGRVLSQDEALEFWRQRRRQYEKLHYGMRQSNTKMFFTGVDIGENGQHLVPRNLQPLVGSPYELEDQKRRG